MQKRLLRKGDLTHLKGIYKGGSTLLHGCEIFFHRLSDKNGISKQYRIFEIIILLSTYNQNPSSIYNWTNSDTPHRLSHYNSIFLSLFFRVCWICTFVFIVLYTNRGFCLFVCSKAYKIVTRWKMMNNAIRKCFLFFQSSKSSISQESDCSELPYCAKIFMNRSDLLTSSNKS